MGQAKKITIQIEEELLSDAMKSTESGITETIRQGLKLIASKKAYENATKLRGKHKFRVNTKQLREDR